MPALEVPTPRPSLVTFVGGPCQGSFEVGGGKSLSHIAAALAVEKYKFTPAGERCRFWGGICEGNANAENYSITSAKVTSGRLEIVCQYDAAD